MSELTQEQLDAGWAYKTPDVDEDTNQQAPTYAAEELAATDLQMSKALEFARRVTDSTDPENLVKAMSLYLNTLTQTFWQQGLAKTGSSSNRAGSTSL